MTPAEKKVLLAATIAPLYPMDGGWVRTDGLGWLPRLSVRRATVEALLDQGLLRASSSGAATLTPAGLVQAKAIRHVLGRRRRKILAAIDAAGELVRRDPTPEWPVPVRWYPPARAHDRSAPSACYDHDLQGLVDRGLVVLLNGGTRAVLSGAGRWCAAGDETASEGARGPSTGASS